MAYSLTNCVENVSKNNFNYELYIDFLLESEARAIINNFIIEVSKFSNVEVWLKSRLVCMRMIYKLKLSNIE